MNIISECWFFVIILVPHISGRRTTTIHLGTNFQYNYSFSIISQHMLYYHLACPLLSMGNTVGEIKSDWDQM
jgi:hypothetical protein